MLSPLGKPVLAANFATMVAINNHAGTSLRAQALSDALITNENANGLADGLGATMAAAYRARALYASTDDGASPRCGEIGPAVTALIAAVNATSRGDAAAGKLGYADGKSKIFPLPEGGTYDVLGRAYGREAGTAGADPNGDSRPFQTAPLDAPSGPRIQTYDATDFFGVATNSRLVLVGAPKGSGRTGSDLTASPSYPSGHTTYGYTEALTLAMMVPERYGALAYRGSEYGHSRIVIGAHYAVDVIGGRTLATYDLAQGLAGTPGYAQVRGTPLRTALAAAAAELRDYLRANGCPSINACALRDPIIRADNANVLENGTFRSATPGQAYAFRLNYGLPALAAKDTGPEPVPVASATLLETRFPYLTVAQRLDILRMTEGPSGRFLDASPVDGAALASGVPPSEAGAYSRLDLYAAAGGYTALTGQVVVNQDAAAISDPDLRPFLDLARADSWSNDISGNGGLTKTGAGTLTLSGVDTYAGPTIVAGGTLEIAGSITSGSKVEQGGTLAGAGRVGDVAVSSAGTLAPGGSDGTGLLEIRGQLELAAGATYALQAGASSAGHSRIAGPAKVDGAHLVLKKSSSLRPGVRMTVLTARGGVRGTFADVIVDAPSLKPTLTYQENAVYLTLAEKSASGSN